MTTPATTKTDCEEHWPGIKAQPQQSLRVYVKDIYLEQNNNSDNQYNSLGKKLTWH